jgi:hypothetical protein
MTIRARFFTAVLAALPLWACSSTSPSSGAAEPGGGVSPGALAGEVNSPMNGTAPGAESGVDAQTPAGVELEPLAFDTVSPLGYSAAEIVSALAPSYAASFTYADDSATPLTVGLASAGQAAYAPGCSRIAIDVVVAWSTADGAFDETLRGKLFALSPEAATLSVEVPAGDLAGSYPSRHAAELGPPPLSFSFELEFAPSAAHGSVSALRGPPDNQDSLGIGSF